MFMYTCDHPLGVGVVPYALFTLFIDSQALNQNLFQVCLVISSKLKPVLRQCIVMILFSRMATYPFLDLSD